MPNERPWWQAAVVYQIYPLSFSDSNGDGMGDLVGIIDKLDYIERLGVDAIWLSPIYATPMVDYGYDISDHTAIDPTFGTMADFDRLLAEVHRRGMKLLLDYVPNHTSAQHPWFLESRSSRENPKRDWYIWRDPGADGGRPNNWIGYWGPCWNYDEKTGQYYLCQHPEMPDLNYASHAVREAMLDVLRFWLEKGVDGFRVDVIGMLVKDDRFLDEPAEPSYTPEQRPYYSLQHIYTIDQPGVHDVIRSMRAVIDSFDGVRVMLGELEPIAGLMSFYGADDECHLPFNLNLLMTPWNAESVRKVVEAYERDLSDGAWPNWILSNHDFERAASRVPAGQVRVAQMMLLTLRGTPICYYGDEIGMSNGEIPPDEQRDPMGRLLGMPEYCRDPERTPMQWSGAANSGFCPPDVEPWLPLAKGYKEANVVLEEGDPRSILHLFQRLADLRRRTPALTQGDYRTLDFPIPDVFVYERHSEDDSVLVALNFSAVPKTLQLIADGEHAHVLLSTELDREGTEPVDRLRLRANEGIVYRIDDR